MKGPKYKPKSKDYRRLTAIHINEGVAAPIGRKTPARNGPCYCGSGRKYKICCGRRK